MRFCAEGIVRASGVPASRAIANGLWVKFARCFESFVIAPAINQKFRPSVTLYSRNSGVGSRRKRFMEKFAGGFHLTEDDRHHG